MRPPAESPELGSDELDRPLAAVNTGWRWLPRRRPALGLQPTVAPALLFVLLGMALGPAGLNVLTSGALGQVEALVWVALAVIGVFVGLGIGEWPAETTGRLFRDGAVVALISVPLVSGALFLLITQGRVPIASGALAGSVLIGICASVSAAVHVTTRDTPQTRHAARLADLDDVPLLLVGVTLVAALAGESAVLRLAATVVTGVAIGVTGLLLFERADPAERGLFMTGTVLLLAGIGGYLGTSPLLSGALAAILWVRSPGRADRITAQDLRPLQHPLVAALLVIAGATVEWSRVVLWVTASTVMLRLTAKLLASMAVSRLSSLSPALLATFLLQPGVLGVALALNAGLLLGEDYRWVVSSVTVSAVVSELLAPFVAHSAEDDA